MISTCMIVISRVFMCAIKKYKKKQTKKNEETQGDIMGQWSCGIW